MQFLPQCVWVSPMVFMCWDLCTLVHMLFVCRSVRVSLHSVGLSVWIRGVDTGWPSGQRFNPSCWKDRPEHRLKLGLKLSDWQKSVPWRFDTEYRHGSVCVAHTYGPGFALLLYHSPSCANWESAREKDSCGSHVSGVKFKTASLLNILNVPSLCNVSGWRCATRLGWEYIFRMLMERK